LGATKNEPINPEDLIRTGIITFFNEAKGYGFIKDSVSQDSVFLHINATSEAVKENMKVTFEVEKGPKGSSAVNVKVVK
jgi:cold shock CspA family protein